MIHLVSLLCNDDSQVAFLFRLLQERPAAANISHQEMPNYMDHRSFVAANPYSVWYIIANDAGAFVGSIYLTKKDEIGVAIANDHQRKGYASQAISELMRCHPRKCYFANVAPGNAVSHALFTKLGGSVVQHTYEMRP